jgi:hypothetical protein
VRHHARWHIGLGRLSTSRIESGPKLAGLSKQFLKAEAQVAALQKQFQRIGSQTGGIKDASRYVSTLDDAIMKTDQQARLLMRTRYRAQRVFLSVAPAIQVISEIGRTRHESLL